MQEEPVKIFVLEIEVFVILKDTKKSTFSYFVIRKYGEM